MTAAVRPLALALALGLACPARADNVADWRPFIAEEARRFDLPASWIARVMAAESAGSTTLDGRPIVSKAGAMGLMQLMPATWAAMRDRLRLGRDAFDPHDNIVAGAGFLRMMYDRFGYPGLFAAYNVGPERYAAALARGTPLPAETISYLAKVVGGAENPAPARPDRTIPPLFIALGGGAAVDGRSDRSSQPDPLFAIRH